MLAYSTLAHRSRSQRNREIDVVRDRRSVSDQALASFLWMTASMAFDLFTLVGPTRKLSEGRDAPRATD
jgi:hypothetical protein